MSLFKYFTKTLTSVSISEGDVSQDNEGSSRSHDGESFAAEAVVTPTRNMKRKSQARSIAKRRRWNEVYMKYGFYCSAEVEHNQYLSANCLFYPVKYCNSGIVLSKLELHLEKQHPEHQYKSKEFFESQLSAICKQKRSFEFANDEQRKQRRFVSFVYGGPCCTKKQTPVYRARSSDITMS